MSGCLPDLVEQCQEDAKRYFGLSGSQTYLDALMRYHEILPENLTAEDNRNMNYLIIAMLEKVNGAAQESYLDTLKEIRKVSEDINHA